MKTTIFLPSKINVGFQNRDDTYTKKLAYVIYYDNKGILRKEKSWESWRDSKIPNEEYDNVPTSGFVLNKKVGGYDTGWNHRQTYVRVYDPRNFEFEISVPNLLYILENATSTKGKGLEGEFVYGFDGKDLVLIPCESPDYKELTNYNDKLKNRETIKGKDLIIGATYLTKENNEVIYIGRYPCYGWRAKDNEKFYFFARRKDNGYTFMESKTPSIILEQTSDKCVDDYAEIFSQFEYYENYNPYAPEKNEYFNHTLESFTNYVNNKIQCSLSYQWNPRNYTNVSYYINNGDEVTVDIGSSYGYKQGYQSPVYYDDKKQFKIYNPKVVENTNRYNYQDKFKTIYEEEWLSIEELFNRVQPQYKKEYLADEKLRKVVHYE